jgi:molybdopterin synthase catalytic subunit
MLRDVTGLSAEEADFEDGADLGAVFARYAERYPRLRDYENSTVMARNRQFASRREPVAEGDEVAFLPPVSGGSGPYLRQISAEGHFFALTREPIDTEAIRAGLARPDDGAVVVFEGVVRNNTHGRPTEHLEYECYEGMAVDVMARIGREIAASFPIGRIAIVHRLGRLAIGETSVVVAVAAPHRRAAFEAALEGIDRLKRLVPIWKKEHFAGGEVWVEGDWDRSLLE